jgi:hypothetical protein
MTRDCRISSSKLVIAFPVLRLATDAQAKCRGWSREIPESRERAHLRRSPQQRIAAT